MSPSPNIEVGSALRDGPTAHAAGAEAAREARAALRIHPPSAFLVFASPRHDLEAVLSGVSPFAGAAPVLGCSTAGEILDGEHRGSVVVAAVGSPYLRVRVGVGAGVSRGWSAALEEALGAPEIAPYFDGTATAWHELTRSGTSAFAFVLSPGNTRHADSKSFEIVEALKRRSLGRLPVFGGSAADDWLLQRNHVLARGRVVEDGVAVAIFETQLQFGIAMAHGLRSTGERVVVGAARDHEVLELDGRPAARRCAELAGVDVAWLAGRHVTLATGVLLGSPDALGQHTPNVASFVTPEGGVRLSRAVPAGTELSVLRADPDTAAAAGPEALRKAMLRGSIARPALALTCCCALRPRLFGEGARQEIPRMAAALGGAPLVGFASFGEQALSDDGSAQHTNAVIGALVLGDELSATAHVARENEALRAAAEEQRSSAERVARRQGRALRTLSQCNAAVVRAEDERELLQEVCRIIVEVGGYRMAWVGYLEHDGAKTVRPVAHAGHEEGYLATVGVVWADSERGRGPVGTAVRSGRPAVVSDFASDAAFQPWREEATRRGYASAVALPLRAAEELLGAICIYSGEVGCFDGDELKLLGDLAQDLAFGIGALRSRADRARLGAQLMHADRLAAIGTLAASVAHEINNPLAYVMAGLEYVDEELAAGAARGGGPPAEVAAALRDVRDGCVRIRQAVRDLQGFSRADEESRDAVDVRPVVDVAAKMAATEIRHRARLVKEYGPVPAVEASAGRIGQVVLNLLINAAHAVREGAAEQNEIRLVTRTDEQGAAVIEVHDTGVGIPPENLERIFEPFFTTKAPGVGTGLGLSICRRLVVAMGGELTVESAVGRGSAFRVRLPPRRGDLPAVAAAPPAAHRPRPGGRVLVVDDEPGVGHAIRRLLSREHQVAVETSSRAALRRLADGERFDLVVCDLMMPEMDGMEFHARLAEVSPETAARVLFLTGGAFTPATAAFLQRVHNPRLHKPFDTDELRRTVHDLVAAAPATARAAGG